MHVFVRGGDKNGNMIISSNSYCFMKGRKLNACKSRTKLFKSNIQTKADN